MDDCYACNKYFSSKELKQCARCEEYHCKECMTGRLCKVCVKYVTEVKVIYKAIKEL